MARQNRNTMNPLPSLLRASAQDAGNQQMRDANRKKWSNKDWNMAAATQERLVRACYALPTDTDDKLCYIRFSIAESWQRQGCIDLYSDWSLVMTEIERVLTCEAA